MLVQEFGVGVRGIVQSLVQVFVQEVVKVCVKSLYKCVWPVRMGQLAGNEVMVLLRHASDNLSNSRHI